MAHQHTRDPTHMYRDIDTWIRDESDDDARLEDRLTLARWFWEQRHFASTEQCLRTREVRRTIGDELTHDTDGLLEDLAGMDVLTKVEPAGLGRYIRHYRSGTNFFAISEYDWVPYLEADLERLLRDLRNRSTQLAAVADGGVDTIAGGVTLRSVAARALDVEPAAVEAHLEEPDDPLEVMERYDIVVRAINQSDAVERHLGYDEMGWRNVANRWGLSPVAEQVQTNETLAAFVP